MKEIDRHRRGQMSEEQELRARNARPGRTVRPQKLHELSPVVGLPFGMRITLTHRQRKAKQRITLAEHA